MPFDPSNTRSIDDMPDVSNREREHFYALVSDVSDILVTNVLGPSFGNGDDIGLMRAMLDGTDPVGLIFMAKPDGSVIPLALMVTDDSLSGRITLPDVCTVQANPYHKGYDCDQAPGNGDSGWPTGWQSV